MKKIILLIGIPGSGKTTLAKRLLEKGFQIISADSIRLELYGNEGEQGDPRQVFAIFFERLKDLFSKDLDVVVDNTNLKYQHRKEIIDVARQYSYEEPQLWLLDVPLQVCIDRNLLRERNVGADIVSNMFKEFNRNGRPKNEEGRLVLIRPGKDENDFRFFFPDRK
jgi:predicted kinase